MQLVMMAFLSSQLSLGPGLPQLFVVPDFLLEAHWPIYCSYHSLVDLTVERVSSTIKKLLKVLHPGWITCSNLVNFNYIQNLLLISVFLCLITLVYIL